MASALACITLLHSQRDDATSWCVWHVNLQQGKLEWGSGACSKLLFAARFPSRMNVENESTCRSLLCKEFFEQPVNLASSVMISRCPGELHLQPAFFWWYSSQFVNDVIAVTFIADVGQHPNRQHSSIWLAMQSWESGPAVTVLWMLMW